MVVVVDITMEDFLVVAGSFGRSRASGGRTYGGGGSSGGGGATRSF